jgi:hypothetical protein
LVDIERSGTYGAAGSNRPVWRLGRSPGSCRSVRDIDHSEIFSFPIRTLSSSTTPPTPAACHPRSWSFACTRHQLDRYRQPTGVWTATSVAKGRLRGKQPKLNPRQKAHLVGLLQAGEHSTAELADLFGVARSTVYRAQQRHQAAARP